MSKESESKDSSYEIPESFICPISQGIMADPYIDLDGNSYEKAAIMDWLSIKSISPITRNPLTIDQIVPNRALKSMIEDFLRANPSASGADAKASPVSMAERIEAFEQQSQQTSLDREPLILFAVIDNSGSMCNPCTDNNRTGQRGQEDDGYSRLDLVKHTLNTIVTSLTEEDQICIIKFHTNASVFTPLMYTHNDNKKRIMDQLESLQPENQTNIWDGLRVAFDEMLKLSAREYTTKNIQLYLLTDGEPTIHPPKPMNEIIPIYMRKFPVGLKPVIHTFGYGYSLDSRMLLEICQVGSEPGVFGFIPDASMVGTVFINALSNSLLSKHQQRSVSSRDESKEEVRANIVEDYSQRLVSLIEHGLGQNCTSDERSALLLSFVEQIDTCLATQTTLTNTERSFLENLKLDCAVTDDASIGQIEKASRHNFYNAWGKHYLRSVLTSYRNRICVNFKDKGMQSFKTDRFIEEQSRIEDIFISLPPPKPSNRFDSYSYGYGGGRGGGYGAAAAPAASAAPASMSNYYNVSGGCFTKDSQLFVSSTQQKKGDIQEHKKVVSTVSALKAGQVVASQHGWTTIEAIVQLKYTGALYQVGSSMTLTPYHPVMIQEQAYFPVDLFDNVELQQHLNVKVSKTVMQDDYVYDVVLANRSILACPLEEAEFFVATFGHKIQFDIFQHEYFGNEAIVKDLQQHKDYKTGHVILEQPKFQRDEISQRVIKLSFA